MKYISEAVSAVLSGPRKTKLITWSQSKVKGLKQRVLTLREMTCLKEEDKRSFHLKEKKARNICM